MSPASEDVDATTEEDFLNPEDNESSEEESEDEAQLIEDGNNQVLKDFETARKNREYSASQTTKERTPEVMDMSFLDWSGFPGAAHSPAINKDGKSDRKPRSFRRSSNPQDEAERRAILRRSSGDHLVRGQTPQPPPAASPAGRRYRNRRHNKGVTPQDGSGTSRSTRRLSADHAAGGAAQGPQNQTLSRRRSNQRLNGISAPNSISLSPSGKNRRPVSSAAAASTMLDVRRNRRTSNVGRKQVTRRNSGPSTLIDSDGLLVKTNSIKW